MTYLPELLSNIDRPRPLANAKTSLPAPTGQLVVQPRPTPTGGMKPVAGTDVPINQKTLPGGTTATAKPGLGSRVLGGLVKGATVGALTTPNTMGDGTISGAIQRQREAGLSEEELISKFGKAAVSQATPLYFDPLPTAQDTSGESQMSRLGDEPMMFSAPTGPSSTATPAAPLAEVLPPEASLMGTESMPTPGVPTSTFDVNTRASDAPEGTVTMPTALADQTIQDSFAPVARNVNELASSGRAAYEGQSLSDFIGYRDKAQAATEQFVDAQGRLRRRDKATQSLADQYSGYEQQAAAREARMGEGSSFGQAVSDRERRGTMSMEDAVKLTRGNRPAAAAMLKRQELGMGEFKPKADTRTPEQVEAAQLANERTRQIIEAGKQPDATPFTKKRSEWEERAEALREDGASEEEIAARRRAFLYGDKFDPWEFGGNGTQPQMEAAGAIESVPEGIPGGAIDKLRENPSLAADFDAKYGKGASSKILNK